VHFAALVFGVAVAGLAQGLAGQRAVGLLVLTHAGLKCHACQPKHFVMQPVDEFYFLLVFHLNFVVPIDHARPEVEAFLEEAAQPVILVVLHVVVHILAPLPEHDLELVNVPVLELGQVEQVLQVFD